jgi:hypothetical protein
MELNSKTEPENMQAVSMFWLIANNYSFWYIYIYMLPCFYQFLHLKTGRVQ